MLAQVYIEARTGDSTSPNGGYLMNSYSLGLIVGIAVALVIVVVVSVAKRGKVGDFDERQELIRGKAYQHAFFVTMGVSALYGVLVMCLEHPLMADGVAPLLAAFVGVAEFASESIWRDAFYTSKTRPRSYIILYAACILTQVVGAVRHISDGDLIENGVLTMNVLPLACAVTFAIILIFLIIKAMQKPKEEDE